MFAILSVLFTHCDITRQSGACANSIDPDEMPNVASHQDLYCLPLIKQFSDTTLDSKLYLLKF